MARRGGSRGEERSNTRNANASATKKASTTTAGNQQPRTAASQGQQSQGQQSQGQQSQGQQSQNASNTGAATARGGDQQRELRTTQERGGVRPSPSPRKTDLEQGSDVFSQLHSLAGASPFTMMRRMMEDMDRLFSPFATTQQAPRGQQGLQRGGQRALQPLSRGLWAPQVELFERGSNLVVRAELPGLSREDVDVEVDDDALVIRGERHNDVEDEHDGYYRSERSYGSFFRAIPLPEGVDASSCNASFKDGVLEVTLPKPTPQVSKAKKINVR